MIIPMRGILKTEKKQCGTPKCFTEVAENSGDVLDKILQECFHFHLLKFSLKSKRGIFFQFYFNSRKAV